MAGIFGTLKWTNSKCGIQKPVEFSFLLLQYEDTKTILDPEEKPFALCRGVKFHLEPNDGKMTEDVFSILEKMDTAFAPHLHKVQRDMACKECQKSGKGGYFSSTGQ